MKIEKSMLNISLFVMIIAMSGLMVGCGNLNLAIKRGDISAVREYLDKGYDIDRPRIDYVPPLMLAIYHCNSEIANLLIDRGADINNSKYETTPLIFALDEVRYLDSCSREEYLEMVNLLIERGADINGKDSNGRTPLIVTLRNGDYESAKMLIEKGAEVPYKNGLLVASDKTFITKKVIGIDPSADVPSLEVIFTNASQAANLNPGIHTISVYYDSHNRYSEPYDLIVNVKEGGIYIVNFEIHARDSILRLDDDTWTPWIEKFDIETGKTDKQ